MFRTVEIEGDLRSAWMRNSLEHHVSHSELFEEELGTCLSDYKDFYK